VELDQSYSGPIVAADRVFTTASEDGEEVVHALHRDTGEELWQARWSGSMQVPFFASKNGSWMRSTPAFDGEHLYVGGMRDVLVCLDGQTGDEVWHVDFVDEYETPLPAFGFVSSPLLLPDGVCVQAGASLIKLCSATGEVKWRTLVDEGGMNGSVFSSPVLGVVGGREMLIALTRTEMAGVDPELGEVLWKQPIEAFRGMNILTPVVHEGGVFTAPYGGRAQLLDVVRDEAGRFQVERRWDAALQGNMTSAVVIDGHAYIYGRNNRFTCVRLEDGEISWVSPPPGDDYWSLVAQGDRILALADTGVFRLIHASSDGYDVKDELEVSSTPTWAHLAVVGDDLYVRDLEGLQAWRWSLEPAGS
jgi:outer membrane protein assembly factor BamB